MKGAVSGSLPGGELSFPACRVLTVAAGWIKQEDECFSFTFRLLWYEILSTELTGRRGSCTCAAALNTRELCSGAELRYDWQQQRLGLVPRLLHLLLFHWATRLLNPFNLFFETLNINQRQKLRF